MRISLFAILALAACAPKGARIEGTQLYVGVPGTTWFGQGGDPASFGTTVSARLDTDVVPTGLTVDFIGAPWMVIGGPALSADVSTGQKLAFNVHFGMHSGQAEDSYGNMRDYTLAFGIGTKAVTSGSFGFQLAFMFDPTIGGRAPEGLSDNPWVYGLGFKGSMFVTGETGDSLPEWLYVGVDTGTVLGYGWWVSMRIGFWLDLGG